VTRSRSDTWIFRFNIAAEAKRDNARKGLHGRHNVGLQIVMRTNDCDANQTKLRARSSLVTQRDFMKSVMTKSGFRWR
jgi:hypothetical protein